MNCGPRTLLAAALLGSALAVASTAVGARPDQDARSSQRQHQPSQPQHRPAPAARHHPVPVPPLRPGVAVVEWDRGHWHHGRYGGRLGWWWVVGPRWYYYDLAVYPYWYWPVPPTRTEVIVEQAQPTGPPPTAYWYWCDEPQGYYPYVAQCAGGWKAVPAAPLPAPTP